MFNKSRQKGVWKDKEGMWNGKTGVKESTIYLGNFKLSIHHYIGCGDDWFSSCGNLFSQISLSGQDIPDLKKQAVSELENILTDALNDITSGIK